MSLYIMNIRILRQNWHEIVDLDNHYFQTRQRAAAGLLLDLPRADAGDGIFP